MNRVRLTKQRRIHAKLDWKSCDCDRSFTRNWSGDCESDVVIQALKHESKQVQRFAYQLLRKRVEPQVKQALQEYKPWNLVERLDEYLGYKGRHAQRFALRQVVEFDSPKSIIDPNGTAYALRGEYYEYYEDDDEYYEDVMGNLAKLLQHPKVGELEALVIGMWPQPYENGSRSLVEALVDAKNKYSTFRWVHSHDEGAEALLNCPPVNQLDIRLGLRKFLVK